MQATVSEAQKIIFAKATYKPEVRPDSIKRVSEENLEIRFASDEELLVKVTKLKNRLFRGKPQVSMNELFHQICEVALKASEPKAALTQKRGTKGVSKATEQAVFARDQERCCNCGTEELAQIDHRVLRSCGGSNDLENLRLLCRACNQRAAIEFFGVEKMDEFLN